MLDQDTRNPGHPDDDLQTTAGPADDPAMLPFDEGAPVEHAEAAPPPAASQPVPQTSQALVPTTPGGALARDNGPKRLPWYTGWLLMTHLALSRDMAQHRTWKTQVEGLRMMDTLERVDGPRTRAALRRPHVWRKVRRVGAVGASLSLAASAPWMLWLLPAYALGHGFGWLAALSFLLPVPLAWKVGRRLYESATINSMQDAERSGPLASVLRWSNSTARTFGAGFGFGFTLIFLQGLITWFMTPASSLALELYLDLYLALVGGGLLGMVSTVVSPLVATSGPAALAAAEEPRQLGA